MTELLGFTVRDKVSNLQGVAVMRVETLHRMAQYAVQPAGDGKIFPEAIMIDEGDLTIEEAPRAAYRPAPATAIGFDQTVKDTVSGFTGKTVAKIIYKDGCVSFTVQPSVAKDGKFPDSFTIPAQRLEVIPVRASLLSRPKVEEPKVPAEKPPGGPRTPLSALRHA